MKLRFISLTFLILLSVCFVVNAQNVASAHADLHVVKEDTGAEFHDFSEIAWTFKTGGKIYSSPKISGGLLFIGSEDGNLYALDPQTGKEKWRFESKGPVHTTAFATDALVYFGSFDGNYYALDKATGKLRWKFKTGGEKWIGGKGYWGMKPDHQEMTDPWQYFLSSPIVSHDESGSTVFFGSSDGNLYAVDGTSGKLQWSFQCGNAIHTTPALGLGSIYFGSWDANIYALDAKNGKLKWKFQTGVEPGMTGIQASCTIADSTVYIGARDAYLYAINATTGQLRWRYDAEKTWIVSSAVVDAGAVYVGTSDSFLFLGIDAKSGKEKFRVKANGYIYSTPALYGKTAFFGDYTGNLFAVDLEHPTARRTFSLEARKNNSARVLKDDLLDFSYLSNGKDMTLYNNLVSVMDELHTLGSIVSSPVVFDDKIYFGSTDGYLYALNLK